MNLDEGMGDTVWPSQEAANCLLMRGNRSSFSHACMAGPALVKQGGKWELGRGEWKLDRGEWKLDRGEWKLDRGEWKLDRGGWKLEWGEWKLEMGEWKLEMGEWKLEMGEWKLEMGEWKLEMGEWKLEMGEWKLEMGEWKLEMGGWELEMGGWELGRGGWELERGGWELERGGWELERGGWELEWGGWKLEMGEWKLEMGARKLGREDGSWRWELRSWGGEDGSWRGKDGSWRLEGEGCRGEGSPCQKVLVASTVLLHAVQIDVPLVTSAMSRKTRSSRAGHGISVPEWLPSRVAPCLSSGPDFRVSEFAAPRKGSWESYGSPVPPEGPEVEQWRQERGDFEREWASLKAVISGTSSLMPIDIEVEGKTEDKQLEDAIHRIETKLTDISHMQSSDDESEEEDDEVRKSKRKMFGDTKHYDPVSLKQKFVLWPGLAELAARYRERTYYFANPENRETFLESPTDFLSKNGPLKPPPLRLVMLGARGAGKSLHARQLAKNLSIFHISFKERLQELIIAKTKKKIGPAYPEDEEEPEYSPEEIAAMTAITGPDGQPVTSTGLTDSAATETSEAEESATEEKEGEEGQKEGETEEEIPLTEDEEAIKNNLESEDALPPDVLDKIVPEWWNKEPFKSTGFILEGFPRTPDEARYMSEQGLFPDGAVLLLVEDTDIIDRLLPPRLAKWRVNRNRRIAKKERAKAKKKKERDEVIAKRRAELEAEKAKLKEERRLEREAQRQAAREIPCK
ncbi:adenylate kinase [Branchiostoma belcheri]|nr:adenylate kinase [Branchiostoma belcheri]